MSSGLRAAREINGGGEPSPDVLFSRRPSRRSCTEPQTTAASQESSVPATKKPSQTNPKKMMKKEAESNPKQRVKSAKIASEPSKVKPLESAMTSSTSAARQAIGSQAKRETKPETSCSPDLPAAPTTPRASPPKTCPACGLSKTFNSSRSESLAYENQIDSLKASVDSLRQEASLREQEHQSALATLRSDLATAQSEILKLVQLGRDQQRHFDVEQATWREREKQLVDAGAATLTREKELEEKVLNFKNIYEEANQKVINLEGLYAKVMEECESFRVEAVALRSECKEQREQRDHSEAQLLSLKEELERARSDHSAMQRTIVDKSLSEAEAKIKAEATRAENAEEKVKTLEKDLGKLKSRLDMAEALPHHLRDEMRRVAERNLKHVDLVESQVSSLREELREESVQRTTLEKEKIDLAKRVSAMQDQVRQLTIDAKGMNAAEFEDTFEAVMREEFDAMRHAYEAKLKDLKVEFSKQRSIHDKSISNVQKESRSKLVNLKTEIMRRDASISQMQKEIENLKSSAQ